MISPIELALVVGVLLLLVMGPKLLPQLGRSAATAPAQAIKGYREGTEALERDDLEAEIEADGEVGDV